MSTEFDPIGDSQVSYDYQLRDEDAVNELGALRDIVEEAVLCERENVHEPDWNCTVLSPLLNIALKSLATSAHIRAHKM